MIRNSKYPISLAAKFYLAVLLPLVIASTAVGIMSYISLKENGIDIVEALRFKAQTSRVLSLLLTQDDASKAILIDPAQLATFSEAKIKAYDEHHEILVKLRDTMKGTETGTLIDKLLTIDQTKLRPIDTRILEILFENIDAARAMYFTDYEPHRLEYEKQIRALAEIGSRQAEEANAKAQQKNLQSIAMIAAIMLICIVVVFVVISLLAAQVERSKGNMRSLMAVLSEGLFFFDQKGAMAAERSEAMAKILPGSDAATSIYDIASNFANVPRDHIDLCLELLWSDDSFMSDFSSTATFLPRRLAVTNGCERREVHIEYRPLYNASQKLDKVVGVVSDVTERLRNEREAIVQAERVRKISMAAANPEAYMTFFEESNTMFLRCQALFLYAAIGREDLPQVKRDLHTLKGSLGTFEFTTLAASIHSLESILEEQGPSEEAATAWRHIFEEWTLQTNDIVDAIGLKKNEDRLLVSKTKFARVLTQAEAAKNDTVVELLTETLRYPLAKVLSKYDTYLKKLMARRSDKDLRLAFDAQSCDVSFVEMQPLDGALVHILRNSLDHGIEDRESRQGRGKEAQGTITLTSERLADGGLRLIISDDGGGIDGKRLAEKAVAKGIWRPDEAQEASYRDQINLIFVANLSTKDEVSETSGRGVGMDAVKDSIEKLGGVIRLESTPLVGTRFMIDLPPRPAAASLLLQAA